MDLLVAGFIRRLRREGLAISPAEGIDAARALLLVGLESRSRVRWALRITLAKTVEAQGIFERAFEAHFAPPRPASRRRRGRGREAGPGAGRRPRRAMEPGEKGRMPGAEPGRPSRQAPEGRPGSPRARPPGRARPEPGRPQREPGRRTRVLARPERGRLERRLGGAPRELRRREFIEPLLERDEAHMAAAIASIVREIRLKPGRRHRPGRRGRLWVKRMLRESLSRGGVPFTLPARCRRPRRPRLIILVDVSWSVARAAGLFLMICRGISDRVGRPSVHLFVDRVVEATREVDLWTRGRMPETAPARPPARRPSPGGAIRPFPGSAPFSRMVERVGDLNPGAPSDYGRAFHQAGRGLLRGSARDTVLLVLGDARTNRQDPLPWAFQELAERCRRVLWLNPEPRRLWNSGDSVMDVYQPFCDAVCEVRDLDGLARGVREMLRSL